MAEETLNKKDTSEKEPTRKEKRQQRREDRITKQLTEEKRQFGLDPAQMGAPATTSRKEEIFENIKKMASDDLADDLKRYSERYTPPTPTPVTKPDEQAMREQIAKERRLKWLDIASGFVGGLAGREFDPTTSLVGRSRAKRGAQLQQYADIVKANRRQAQEWDAKYKQEMIDYLEQKINEGKLSAIEARKTQQAADKLKAEIELSKAKVGTEKARQRYWLGKASEAATAAKKDVDKGKSATYKYKTKDGREMSLSVTDPNVAATLTNAITESDRLKAERDNIQEQMDNEIYMAESTGFLGMGKSKEEVQAEIRAKYQPLLAEAENNLRQSEETITSIFEKGTAPTQTVTETVTPQAGEKTPLDDILENL